MTVKNDKWIRESGVLTPCLEFTNTVDGKKIISKGISSYGYDLTCSDQFKVFKNCDYTDPRYPNNAVDPKDFKDDNFRLCTGDHCIIPPNSFVLTSAVEYIKMPRNIVGVCMGKSTYARCGIVANITLLEPEWEGLLVIELSNTSPLPVKIYANEGIAQVVFLEASDVCEISYADRKGKYQKQSGITTAKV